MDSRSETSEKDLDMESIDIIAKHNLNLSVIGQVSANCSLSPKPFYKEEQLLNMSSVSIREEDRSSRSSVCRHPWSTLLTSVAGKWSTRRGNNGACLTT